MNIARIMIPKVMTVFLHDSQTVRQALETMLHHGYTALPVLDGKQRYAGCITEGDFLRHIMDTGSCDRQAMEELPLREILRNDFCPALSIDAAEKDVIELIQKQNFVPVVDSQNALCGILTRQKVISYLAEKAMR